ncbi:HEAT repeat domain-containing protein [Patescibacteria group bacterium]
MIKIFNITLKDILLYGTALGITTLVLVFLISVTIIGHGVKDTCQMAKDTYSGTCVSALISYLDDPTNDMRNRNSAVWALGQLGDTASLETLKKFHTGEDEFPVNLSQELSQLQLKRAIGYMEGNPNITTFFWRFGQSIE